MGASKNSVRFLEAPVVPKIKRLPKTFSLRQPRFLYSRRFIGLADTSVENTKDVYDERKPAIKIFSLCNIYAADRF